MTVWLVRALGFQERHVDFVETCFTSLTELTVVRNSAATIDIFSMETL
jgi:hypothetical protein